MATQPYLPSRRPAMMAMVLGAALTALGPSVQASESHGPRAVNDISRYCTSCWRNARLPADRWGDCTQEVFQRLLERVPTARWPAVFTPEGSERAEFLRAIDTVKKRVQRDRHRMSRMNDDAHDVRQARQEAMREEREMLRLAIVRSLTVRQQRIVQRTLEGWSVAEIAAELGMSSARISDEKYKAIHKLRVYFEAV